MSQLVVAKRIDTVKEILVSDVVFRQDLYPRIDTSAVTVQKYAENLSVLPPIEVNQFNEIIDGWHRWTAHKKEGAETIQVTVTKTASDAEFLELAISRNAKHGLQLSLIDKKKMAVRIYGLHAFASQRERQEKKVHLAQILSVSIDTIQRWTDRTDKDVKAELRQKAFDLWMSCHTQDEIAEAIGYAQKTVANFLKSCGFSKEPQVRLITETDDSQDEDEKGLGRFKLTKEQVASADHAIEFDAPIYNVWKQQDKTLASEHFGNSEVRWVDNLLYLYTQPFDIVVDPFAGGGSTIDICKKRLRRYWVSDRKPIIEREHDIRQHDLTEGSPKLPNWQDVKLVYLDPPYWKQAEEKYSKDPTDLANMPLDQFTQSLATIINGFSKKLSPGAVIALLLQPTQWKAPEHKFTDHVIDICRAVKLPIDMRVSCPYESQQCNAQMVTWAKENRKVLVLSRELVIWRI